MPDYKVIITIKDVTKGDVQGLIDDIENEHGEDFDMSRGDFQVDVSERHGDQWFPVELVGDDSW